MIFRGLRCDGKADCKDNSDEKNCGTSRVNCTGLDHFNCSDTGKECVLMNQVCDNVKQCLNGNVSLIEI